MKLRFKLLRAVQIPGKWLEVAVGRTGDYDMERAIKEKFGPLAPRLNIFVRKEVNNVDRYGSTIGMEAMAFDIRDVQTPSAKGVVMTDPLFPEEISRLDGALISELSRFGIEVQPQDIIWMSEYTLEGN